MRTRTHIQFRSALLGALASILLPGVLCHAEDDYDFMPAGGWENSTSVEGDQTSRLVDGYPGLSGMPGKNKFLEPVDGSGGFDNVAPSLGIEEGPGGLDWDPSPSYRTRYKGAADFPASGGQLQGNNWFTSLPYRHLSGGKQHVRFDANTYRIFELDSGSSDTYHLDNGGNRKVVMKKTTGPTAYKIYDMAGKIFTFPNTESYKLTEIDGVGDAEIEITYNSGDTTVMMKSDSSTEVKRIKYVITDHGSGDRIDKVEVAEKDGASWDTYRTIDFTYHEQVTGAVGSADGDLIGIEEERDLSESGKTYKRRWVYKYYTGTFNASTNPGYPYQVEAVLDPGSVHEFEVDNPTLNIYKRTVSQLSRGADVE